MDQQRLKLYMDFYDKYLIDLNNELAKNKLEQIILESEFTNEEKEIANRLIKMI